MGTKRARILIGVGSVTLLVVGWFVYEHLMFVTTDNAQVQAHTILLSSKVPGVVTKVNVLENQKVKAGDVLVQIDDRDYASALAQREAELASLEAHGIETDKNYRRIASLYKQNAVPQSQFDTAQASARETDAKLKALRSQVELARVTLAYSQLKAPSDGIVARKSVEPGMYASVGQPLVGFVDGGERWVTANFKETELDEISVGKKVDITVDAISGKTFQGHVDSVSPSTGATFTLLPPDNATGNFTKVVQRVPVRIKLDNVTPQETDRLQAGLSAYVKVHVR